MLQSQQSTAYYVRAFQRGEEAAYDYFFKAYFRALCFFARTLLPEQHPPEDLVQDCFIRLWEKHWTIKNPDAIRAFLYATVRNACRDLARKKKILHTTALTDNLTAADDSLSAEDNLIRAELLREIVDTLESLPARVREVVKLYYLEGKNDAEISQQLKTSSFTVRNQRFKAIQLLRKKFT